MKKPQGHYCRVCGRRRANEKFSGKGHAAHICKDCARERRAGQRARRKAATPAAAKPTGAGQANAAFRGEIQGLLNRYYAEFPDEDLARRAAKGLRFLANAEVPLQGQAGEWAAALAYALAVPDKSEPRGAGSLHDDLTRVFGVDSETVRQRATDVRAELSVFPDPGV